MATKVHKFQWQSCPLASISEAKDNLQVQIDASSDPPRDIGLYRMMEYKVLCELEEMAKQELGQQKANDLILLDRTLTTAAKIMDLTDLETEPVTPRNAGQHVTYYLSLISTLDNPAGRINRIIELLIERSSYKICRSLQLKYSLDSSYRYQSIKLVKS